MMRTLTLNDPFSAMHPVSEEEDLRLLKRAMEFTPTQVKEVKSRFEKRQAARKFMEECLSNHINFVDSDSMLTRDYYYLTKAGKI